MLLLTLKSTPTPFDWSGHLITAVELLAAVLYLLEFLGVFRFVRSHVFPRLAWPSPSSRFWSAGRVAVFVGLALTVSLGYAHSSLAKAVISVVLILVVVGKETLEWKQAKEPPSVEYFDSGTATITLTGTGEEEFIPPPAEEPETDPPAASPPAKRTRVVVMHNAVELSAPAGMAFMPITSVVCDVTAPSGVTYRAKVTPTSPATGMSGAFAAFVTKRAVVLYPTEFDHAPSELASGPYHVRWEIPDPLSGLLNARVYHDAFRIQ